MENYEINKGTTLPEKVVRDLGSSFFLNANWHISIVRFLVCALMVALYVWICAGIISLGVGLYHITVNGWPHEARSVITSVVTVLALLELVRTFQSYLELGRIKLRFIVDAALVVLIGELIGLWYQEHTLKAVIESMTAIVTLTAIRYIAIKYSPEEVH